MTEIIDATGLSCPQPVLLTLELIKKTDSEKLEVIVDTTAARENVERAANSKGWVLEYEKKEKDVYNLIFTRK